MKRTVSSLPLLVLGCSLAISAATSGCAARVGVYDPGHEDVYYRQYWTENHGPEPFRDYNHVDAKEQKNYWNWRHSHPDKPEDKH